MTSLPVKDVEVALGWKSDKLVLVVVKGGGGGRLPMKNLYIVSLLLGTINKFVPPLLQEKVMRVTYVWVLCRDQEILDPRSAWRLLDLSANSAHQWV